MLSDPGPTEALDGPSALDILIFRLISILGSLLMGCLPQGCSSVWPLPQAQARITLLSPQKQPSVQEGSKDTGDGSCQLCPSLPLEREPQEGRDPLSLLLHTWKQVQTLSRCSRLSLSEGPRDRTSSISLHRKTQQQPKNRCLRPVSRMGLFGKKTGRGGWAAARQRSSGLDFSPAPDTRPVLTS